MFVELQSYENQNKALQKEKHVITENRKLLLKQKQKITGIKKITYIQILSNNL